MSSSARDEPVFVALDAFEYAPSLGELAARVGASDEEVLASLQRLVQAQRVWMTADPRTRAYYTRPVQLL